jgi:hypothetical protein
MSNPHRSGFSWIGIIVAMVCVAIVTSMTLVALRRVQVGKRTIRESLDLRGIHQGWLAAAREFNGFIPTPGLIKRLPSNGAKEPGRGEEDVVQNTTANLHSALIMQNYYSPQIVVSPNERNPNVRVRGKDEYDLTKYNISSGGDCCWDDAFKADLASESNVSYASMPLFGVRKDKQWKESLDGEFAILGNRGPKDGEINPKSYTCDPSGNWQGWIVFNDGSIERLKTTTSPFPYGNESGARVPDNLFHFDDGKAGRDAILGFTQSIGKDDVTLQWD